MTATYFLLLYTVVAKPGYVERSAQWYTQQDRKKKIRRSVRIHSKRGFGASEKDPKADGDIAGYDYAGHNAPLRNLTNEQRPSLQDFTSRDAFICQGDGRPIWCTHCYNWKPDRAHHCREVGRCVRKMDHFCPWVGGVVSETSFKLFIQFVGWAAIFCVFNLILIAILVAEYNRKTGTINVHWVVTLALGALFGIFAAGMTGSSLQFALLNTTTIETLSRKNVVYQLAIHMPRPPDEPPPFPTISYSTAPKPETSEPSLDTIKTFAILHTRVGDNPWDLGAFRNFKSVMGEHWYEWFLPINRSPCSNHDRLDGQFAFGPVVDRMKREAGILPPFEPDQPQRRRRQKRRRRHPRDENIQAENAVAWEKEQSNPGSRDTGHDRQEASIGNGNVHDDTR
ncbi:MAG: hypothetical protein Q9217_006360 [Psora testacea]